MIQLSYQKCFDPYNAVFRILQLKDLVWEHTAAHKDLVRILDFYLVFPFELKHVSVERRHMPLRTLAIKESGTKRPYANLPPPPELFSKMSSFQEAAIATIASQGFLDRTAWLEGEVKASGKAIPELLNETIVKENHLHPHLLNFIRLLATQYDLRGGNGLKKRTKLMEHRYDAV